MYLQLDRPERQTALAEAVRDARLGEECTAYLDAALYARIPAGKPRKDARQGTIDQDIEFIDFLETLTNPQPKQHVQDDSLVKPTTTPLVQFLIDKKSKSGLDSVKDPSKAKCSVSKSPNLSSSQPSKSSPPSKSNPSSKPSPLPKPTPQTSKPNVAKPRGGAHLAAQIQRDLGITKGPNPLTVKADEPTSGRTQAFMKNAFPSQGVTTDALRDAFSKYGSLKHVELDRRKGYAYVDFHDPQGLQNAKCTGSVQVGQALLHVQERRVQSPGSRPPETKPPVRKPRTRPPKAPQDASKS